MNIFFSGIGGVGIGPLTLIALDAGYQVQGSDQTEGLMTKELSSRGVNISTSQDGSFLRACHEATMIDWFVYTAALPEMHPELVAARELGIRTAKRDELLAHILREKKLKLIAVAGTHGKTTTTGMMVWTLKQLGVPLSYAVGTTLSWGPSGHYEPASEYFVYECDEFDRNFLHFEPYLSLVTSLDYDHPDTYASKQDYLSAFSRFVDQSQLTIGWQHDLSQLDFSAQSWQLGDNEVADIALPGLHNRQNATLVLKAIEKLLNGQIATQPTVSNALSLFPGTNRRFEKIADNLYSDYGHHPKEIAATLQMARELSEKVILIYQPHQNVRQHEVRDEYTDKAFRDAQMVYWLPTYLSREDPALTILSTDELTSQLATTDVVAAQLDDKLWHTIENHRQNGALILCMGAGSIDSWVRQQLTYTY